MRSRYVFAWIYVHLFRVTGSIPRAEVGFMSCLSSFVDYHGYLAECITIDVVFIVACVD